MFRPKDAIGAPAASDVECCCGQSAMITLAHGSMVRLASREYIVHLPPRDLDDNGLRHNFLSPTIMGFDTLFFPRTIYNLIHSVTIHLTKITIFVFLLYPTVSIAGTIQPTVLPSFVNFATIEYRFSQFIVDLIVQPAEPL